ncbi:hypothetical protein [Propioniciclava sinopodophylli]|uniref:hypothetical protein n=1 Tax=Propioniciclava sinopodophylli TaxID=1837344 RepID=UPI0024903E36|nr:hypothetical protein [Propioniciclava sinopodophylli]
MTIGTTPTTADTHNTTATGRRGTTVWASIRAGLGALLGLVPHVMHHIGLLAGAAILTGALGNSVLYVVGLLFSIPLLRRLRSRFNTWRAPALGVVAFTALFAVSAFVVGPALSGSNAPETRGGTSAPASAEHDGHHP